MSSTTYLLHLIINFICKVNAEEEQALPDRLTCRLFTFKRPFDRCLLIFFLARQRLLRNVVHTGWSAAAEQYLRIRHKDDCKFLAQGYLPGGSPRKYCDPCTVSLPSSRWIGVVPVQQVHQEIVTSCFA